MSHTISENQGENPPQDTLKRVLVVDDSRSQRITLKALLSAAGYDVLTAEDGKTALEIIGENPPSFIISDWIMPGMSGPELCQKIRQNHPDGNIYLILLTSKSDKADVSTGLNAGADDFLSKPLHKEELFARMQSGMRIVELQQGLIDRNEELDRAHHRLRSIHDNLEDDLRAAAKLQQVYIPPEYHEFDQWSIATVYKPCAFIGGDLVGYFPVSVDEIGIYSIDVAGHGVSSALKTVTLAQSLNPYDPWANLAFAPTSNGGLRVREPHELMAELNRRHQDDSETDQYFTMVYAIVNRKTCKVRMCQAGHPNPVLLRQNGAVEYVGEGGAPVGLFSFAEFDTIEFTLQKQDRLFLYSDGVTECERPDGSLWDEEGLSELFAQNAGANLQKFPSRLIDEMVKVHGADDFTDDVSGVLIDLWSNDNSLPEPLQIAA